MLVDYVRVYAPAAVSRRARSRLRHVRRRAGRSSPRRPRAAVSGAPPPPGVLVVSQEQQASWVRNFNPLSTATAARWPTLAGIYEPLFVFNSVRCEYVPWLAVAREWREGNRVLRMTTRDSVLWSDGRPFSARDVAFTFGLLRRFPALDRRGVWGFLVRRAGRSTAAPWTSASSASSSPASTSWRRSRSCPSTSGSDVADPVAFANEHPVATGPVHRGARLPEPGLRAGPQSRTTGSRACRASRRCASPPTPATTAPTSRWSSTRWTGRATSSPRSTGCSCSRRPRDHRYWFPLTGSSIFLYANTGRAPFDDVRVRKALSMAIDRDLLVDVALYRYSRPADATGLSDAYAAWRDSAAVAAGDWVRYDAARANALLDEAGFRRGADGMRRLPDGRPWRYEVLSVSGWSDWVRAAAGDRARPARRSASTPRCAPTTSAPGSSACRRATSTSASAGPSRARRRTSSTAGSCPRRR